jgi:hypothetical protein
MKKSLVAGILFLVLLALSTAVIFIPNPLGAKVLAEAKYRGYLDYTPEEAVTLAYKRCAGCHKVDKVLKFCSACGPPFIVTALTMRKHVEVMNAKGEHRRQFSDAELIAIVQVWNALVGNWEPDWPQKDIITMLRGNESLIQLAKTPLAERPIEMALKDKKAPGSYTRIYSDKIKNPCSK